jgi:hypothetical protein
VLADDLAVWRATFGEADQGQTVAEVRANSMDAACIIRGGLRAVGQRNLLLAARAAAHPFCGDELSWRCCGRWPSGAATAQQELRPPINRF